MSSGACRRGWSAWSGSFVRRSPRRTGSTAATSSCGGRPSRPRGGRPDGRRPAFHFRLVPFRNWRVPARTRRALRGYARRGWRADSSPPRVGLWGCGRGEGLMDFNKLTLKSQEAVGAAQELARRMGNPEIYPEHLLLALLDQELPQQLVPDASALRAEAETALRGKPSIQGGQQQPQVSRAFS